MFDISFSEILLIAVVALVVLGPERLPKVARTLGHLFGRFQRYVADVKAEMAQEMELGELRNFESQVRDAAQAARHAVNQEIGKAHQMVTSPESQPASEKTDAPPMPDTPRHEIVEIEEPSPQLELSLDEPPSKKTPS